MLKFLNFPLMAASALLVRILILGASLADGLSLTALAALYAYHLFLESKKQPVANKDLLDRIISLEEDLGKTKNKVSSMSFAPLQKR